MKMIAGRGNRCVADITKRTKRYNAMWREKRYLRRVLTANYVQDACINLSRATFKIWNLWKIETIGVFLEKLGESFWQMRRERNLKRLQLVEIAKERANATFFNFFLWHRNEDLNNTFQRVAQTAFSIKCSPYINVAHVLFKFSLESQVKQDAKRDLCLFLRHSDRLQVSETIFSYVTLGKLNLLTCRVKRSRLIQFSKSFERRCHRFESHLIYIMETIGQYFPPFSSPFPCFLHDKEI